MKTKKKRLDAECFRGQ